MKSINKIIVLFLTLTLLTPILSTAKGRQDNGGNNRQSVATELYPEEESTLLWMREEEKLARDVYLAMDDQWNKQVFRNIASSEQSHMNAVLRKINLFGLSDPVLPDRGEFYSDELQFLYDSLVIKGQQSYIDALEVGATIEDLDIADLIRAITATDNLALKTTYERLLEGSKNHLRAFIGLLQQQGIDYQPEYISQELFDAIIDA
ncbi:DUF2202 domain-containing protein [methanotrophic endosymbiont of Bathymodiolus puteoserpentis (Logatchev)]|jgi:hypothetical protein|uniref:DUF2202 domain-containing protein n=1 Tax=methanotrophic endosymbiont of Bathymodiolus puteoserpentis (Logatchev) TaxID=343235 RepID=UPI0013CCA212|nr:DUF2202 domain-containing protein [methanotrophic endosymbiont of Bathymodiolus puteoserpentis (Logatchev)]SHE20853.1 Uncharacterized protein MJ0754 [methanotrophic endosymbiont of Bathymodiolus puteoserpentis (Logatchev)]